MSYQDNLNSAKADLAIAWNQIQSEIRNYPTPVSGCDAQFNYLLGLRSAISNAQHALAQPPFVPTPRTLTPHAGVESR